MSGKKISELQELLALENDDLLLVSDADEIDIENKSKNVKISTIRAEIDASVAVESADRSAADSILSLQIVDEATTRALEDSSLQQEIDDRVTPIETRSQFNKIYAYSDNSSVYADGALPDADTTPLRRDGWYFTNSEAGSKINWYFFDGNPLSGTFQGDVELQHFSAFAIVTLDSLASLPILAIYTRPTGTGDVIPGFAHSRVVYSGFVSGSPIAGQKCLIYFGQDPQIHPELPRFEMAISVASTVGEQDPSELVLTSSFGSNSVAAVGDVQFLAESLGVFSPTVKQNMELRLTEQMKSKISFIEGFRFTRTSATTMNISAGKCSSDDNLVAIELEDSVLDISNTANWKNGTVISGVVVLKLFLCKRVDNTVYLRVSPESSSITHADIVDNPSDKKRYIGSIPTYTNNTIFEFLQTGEGNTRVINYSFNKPLMSNISTTTTLSSTVGGYQQFPINTTLLNLQLYRTSATASTTIDQTIASITFRCTLDQYDMFDYYPMATYGFVVIKPTISSGTATLNIATNQTLPVTYFYNKAQVEASNILLRVSNILNGGFSVSCSGYVETL